MELLGQWDPQHELIIEDPYYVSSRTIVLHSVGRFVSEKREKKFKTIRFFRGIYTRSYVFSLGF